MTTTVPGLARSIAARIASRRSAMRRYFVAPDATRPRSTSERIASGSSDARIVGGRDRDVGERARDPTHRLALAAVAVAAAAEHEDDLAVGQLPHGREQARERVLRVRVVDEDRVGLSGLDRARAGRDTLRTAASAAATSSAGGTPSARPPAAAASRLSTLNRPSSGDRTRNGARRVPPSKSTSAERSQRADAAADDVRPASPTANRSRRARRSAPRAAAEGIAGVDDGGAPGLRSSKSRALGLAVAPPCRDGSRGGRASGS